MLRTMRILILLTLRQRIAHCHLHARVIHGRRLTSAHHVIPVAPIATAPATAVAPVATTAAIATRRVPAVATILPRAILAIQHFFYF